MIYIAGTPLIDASVHVPERPYFTIISLSILNLPQISFERTSLITIIIIIYWIFIKNAYF